METRIEIQQYIPALRPEWDCFIANSRNGTFLFFRNYMDYHSDRFIDNSLLFRYKGKLIAVLPANREGDVLWSHQGLTYGGLVLSSKCTADRVLNIFSLLFSWLSERGFSKLVYKCVPDIYHRYPSQEDLYALFRNNAEVGCSQSFHDSFYSVQDSFQPTASSRNKKGSVLRDCCTGIF